MSMAFKKLNELNKNLDHNKITEHFTIFLQFE
jgi:hypothetical protein